MNNRNGSPYEAKYDPTVQVPTQRGNQCAGCRKLISERYLLKALDMLWHEDCLKCSCCDCRLGEVGSVLYTKPDSKLLLCKRDYLRMFGPQGICSNCCQPIPAFEFVMRAREKNYHLDCFACHQCRRRFCVGERFYLHDNHILCELDYRQVSNGPNLPHFAPNMVPHEIKPEMVYSPPVQSPLEKKPRKRRNQPDPTPPYHPPTSQVMS